MSDFYDDADSLTAYLAHRHADVRSPNLVMEDPAFRRELGSVEGLDVLDLGCGDGTFAVECIEDGCASYLGVDASAGMIERARIAAPKARFERQAMEQVDPASESCDLVVSRMALHYLVDLASVLAAAHRALRPGGRLLLSVVHPILTSALAAPEGQRTNVTVDNYFAMGSRTRPWFGSEVVWQHRTLENYVTAVLKAEFELTALRECAPVEELFDGDAVEFERRQRVPVFLLLAASR